ncbi:snoRNA-binding rRNA-processing protein utp10 [Coemansia aciculifera]|uniref:U3 small nucleolar RNA-associated protein 10 n=1 Tax=Coemansia aciculifera TaxID=417176 RepID=A0A9W8M0Z4_9FUNG|nr:snoRNA-binding rRNA-processing protein utp10 [Coemansia aciculifera]
MASSLASQLYKMRTLDRAMGNERAHNVKASFLFDGRQAADLDTQTIFDIGRDGLYELRQVNQRFDVYAETLFSESIKDMDRVLQTKEENAKLDESIRSFLFQLAPHFLTKPAGKTIEWLVRRFRIHEFNARDVLAAIMPYHETKAFLTMLTIITFETADMDLFGFLVAQRKSRRLLDRQTLMAQCLRDRSLMAFVCQAVFRACRQGLDYPGLHSFYAMVMSQYIGQLSTIDNSAIQFIVPFVLDGLNFSSKDAQAAAYMVLGSLATRVTLTEEALDKVLCAVAQRPADVRTMAMCLVQVLQTQADAFNSRLPARFLGILASHSKLPRVLCQLAESFNVEMFMRPLLSSLAHYAFTNAELSQFLAALVAVLPVSYAPTLCERIVAEYVAHGLENKGPAEIVDIVQLRYGQQMEDAIGAAAGSSEMGDREAVHKLLYELKARGSGNKSGVVLIKETATTLYLSINHADAGIRLVAAKALKAIATGERTDVELVREETSSLIVDRLAQDDSESVLEVVLSLPLATLVDAQELVPALVSVIEDERVPIGKLCSKVVRNLLAIDDLQVYGQVASALFPYLLKCSATEAVTKAVYKHLPGSAFGRQKSGWLACLASAELDSGLAAGKFNKSVARVLATELAAKWDSLADAQTGVWVAQLGSGNSLARITAIVVGAHAEALLAKAKDVDRCVAAASLVVGSALSVLLEADSSAVVSEDVLLASVDGSGWTSLLGSLASVQRDAVAKVAGGALSATLSVLSSVVRLTPNQWFSGSAGEGCAESQYRSLLRTTFGGIVSRAGKLSNSDGVLIGRVLGLGMGDEWAQFLASTWTAESSSALVKSRSLISFQALLRHKTAGSSAEKIDYQTVLPSVIVALGDEDARVRGAAVACVKTLHLLYPAVAVEKKQSSSRKSLAAGEQTIYRYDVFYGATSDRLQYLPTAIVAKFVAMLASRVDSMASDAWAVRNELDLILNRGVCSGSGSGKEDAQLKLNSQGRSSVVAFLLSHVVATDMVATGFQTRLLQALELVTSPAPVLAQLYPLIASHYDELKRTVGIPQEGGSEDVLVRALFRACFCEANAPQLGELGCWQAFMGFVAGLDSAPAEWTPEARATAYVQQVALERLMTGLVAAMGAAAVTDVTTCLFRVAVRGTAYLAPADVRQVALRDVYAAVSLDAAAAADELSEIAAKLTLDDSDAARAGKRARAQAPAEASVLPELGTLLEYMQCSPALAHSAALVPALFALLNVFVSDVGSSAEYAKQLVLGMLTRICDEANAAGVVISESFMRVDVIVQVIRTSARPQTHNQTLLLLAGVAAMHPRVVLHNVMAIFTFMGANAVRQDDDYSFHVIQQTLERVVPPVVRDGGAENAGPVLRVFVDALSHIPRHRRMALFSTLVRTMGADVYGPAVVSLLLEKNVRRMLGRTPEDAGKERDDIVSFALSLTHELLPAQQIGSAEAVVRDLLLLPSGDEDAAAAAAVGQELFVDVAHMGSRQLRAYRLVALDFAHQLLTSRQFRAQFDRVRATPEINARLSSATSTLLQVITRLNAAAVVERAAEKQALQLAYAVLDDVNALMERRAFVSTVVSLLEQSDLKIRRKVMALANAKLTEFNVRLVQSDSSDIDEMLAMLPPIAAIAEQASVSAGAEEVACKQAALLCVATAAKKFAVLRPTLFTGVVKAVSAAESLGSGSAAVASAALVALAVLCNELGSRLIPSLPQYLPQVLKHLHGVVGRYAEASADDLTLMVAALSAMLAIVENMSAFLAPTLAPLFSCLLNPAIRSAPRGDGDVAALREQASGLIDDVLAAVAKCIPPRQLLPAQFAFYQKEASRQGAAVIVPFVAFVGRTAASLQRNQLLQFYKPLFKFFLAAFDIARNPALPLSEVEVIEQATLDAFMRFVVKLNENLFKPLFLSFLEWATADVAPLSGPADEARLQSAAETRLRVFYRALNVLFDKLKSILTPYYAHVLDTTVEVLNRFAVARASIELQEEADRKVIPAPSALWHAVVESIYQSALHDTTDFWKEDTFKRVFRPLANQLPNTKAVGVSAEQAHALYIERVRKCLAPAASQLAAAAGNDALWKMINQEVMLKSRSDVPAVRVASLLVLQAFYAKLGEEFLILLPETIPYLAELLEDDNGLVERATQETVKVIESHLGESLQSYLR